MKEALAWGSVFSALEFVPLILVAYPAYGTKFGPPPTDEEAFVREMEFVARQSDPRVTRIAARLAALVAFAPSRPR
jgi:hypothetical protein